MQLLRTWKLFIVVLAGLSNAVATDFRPPAVPLVATSPYFSVRSMADHLTDDVTRYWTGTPQSLPGLTQCGGRGSYDNSNRGSQS